MKQPNSRANLDRAIQRLADGDRGAYIAVRAVIANAVVGQMLPEGAVKGGSAIKLRLGNVGTRFTTDLDVAHLPSAIVLCAIDASNGSSD